jgi:hypothetical protein
MKKIVILFSGLIIFAIVLSLLAMPRPTLAQDILPAIVDIKPGSCPSSINLNKKKGVTPVAIVCTADFDVAMVDVTTVEILGVQPVASETLDSTEQYDSNIHSVSDDIKPGLDECYDCFSAEDNLNCYLYCDDAGVCEWSKDCGGDMQPDCTDYCGDSCPDLIVYFNTVDLAGVIDDTGCVELTLTGSMTDGTPFAGSDIARIK